MEIDTAVPNRFLGVRVEKTNGQVRVNLYDFADLVRSNCTDNELKKALNKRIQPFPEWLNVAEFMKFLWTSDSPILETWKTEFCSFLGNKIILEPENPTNLMSSLETTIHLELEGLAAHPEYNTGGKVDLDSLVESLDFDRLEELIQEICPVISTFFQSMVDTRNRNRIRTVDWKFRRCLRLILQVLNIRSNDSNRLQIIYSIYQYSKSLRSKGFELTQDSHLSVSFASTLKYLDERAALKRRLVVGFVFVVKGYDRTLPDTPQKSWSKVNINDILPTPTTFSSITLLLGLETEHLIKYSIENFLDLRPMFLFLRKGSITKEYTKHYKSAKSALQIVYRCLFFVGFSRFLKTKQLMYLDVTPNNLFVAILFIFAV